MRWTAQPVLPIMRAQRPLPLIAHALLLLLCIGAGGCSPTFDWRVVRHPEGIWSATFPDKPAVVERTVQMPVAGRLESIQIELRAARVNGQTFTVGLARPASGAQVNLDDVRLALEEAMVRNIQGRVTAQAPLTRQPGVWALQAEGQIRLEADKPAVTARVMMRSARLSSAVIEILVAGPSADFSVEAAEQFLDSLELGEPPRL